MNNKKYDLEERLINFSVLIIDVSRKVYKSPEGIYFSGQIIRSGSSPALNYGEVQAAESRRDFIHKSRIVLKELRETLVNLKIIKRARLSKDLRLIDKAFSENNELVAIFVTSIKTAENNSGKSN